MYYTTVRKDRLRKHLNNLKRLDDAKRRKNEILSMFGVKGYDYSKIKVTSGSKKMTDQERAVIALEKINREIRELEAIVYPEQKEIEAQIDRVNEKSDYWQHADVLRRLYVDCQTIKDIIIDYNPSNYTYINGHYKCIDKDKETATRRSIEGFRDTAIKILGEISETPFIPCQRHLLEDWSDGHP